MCEPRHNKGFTYGFNTVEGMYKVEFCESFFFYNYMKLKTLF